MKKLKLQNKKSFQSQTMSLTLDMLHSCKPVKSEQRLQTSSISKLLNKTPLHRIHPCFQVLSSSESLISPYFLKVHSSN